jgi:starch phosphorylase
VYYLSLEFLLGRALDNALLNLNLKKEYESSVNSLGFSMEDVLDSERDAGLGNGGLGRLAACYSESFSVVSRETSSKSDGNVAYFACCGNLHLPVDSLSSMDIPAWGYGLRYQYGSE